MITLNVAADLLNSDRLPMLIQYAAQWAPNTSGGLNFVFEDRADIVDATESTGIGFVETDQNMCIAVQEPGRYQFIYEDENDVGPDEDLDNDHTNDETHDLAIDEIPATTPLPYLERVAGNVETATVHQVTTPQTAIPVITSNDFQLMFNRLSMNSVSEIIAITEHLRALVDVRAAELVRAQRDLASHIHRSNSNFNVIGYNRLVDAIERIRQCSDVDSIGMFNTFLVVKTKEISTVVEIEGHRRLLGHMLIGFNMRWIANPGSLGSNNPDHATIRVWNADREYDNYQCGHVRDTYPCLGGYMSQLAMAAAECNLDQMVEIMLRFLKNPEPTDGYCTHLAHWPVAEAAA